METKQIRISNFTLEEVRNHGKRVNAQTDDVSLRFILNDYKRLLELERFYKEKLEL